MLRMAKVLMSAILFCGGWFACDGADGSKKRCEGIADCGHDFGPPKKDSGTCHIDGGGRACGAGTFLPASDAIDDFKNEGSVKGATNSCELELLIDGGAEKYSQNKFNCMVLAKYKSVTKSIAVDAWIFDQTDNQGAEGAYQLVGTLDDTPLTPTLGDASQENLKLPFSYTATMRKGKYVVRIFVDKKEGKNEGMAFLKNIESAIK